MSRALMHGGVDAALHHDFCLLGDSEGPFAREFRQRGHRILGLPIRPVWTFPQRLYRLLRRQEYDAVHSHVFLFSGVVLAVAWAAGARLRIAHAHNDSDGRRTSLVRSIYRSGMRALISQFATQVVGCTRRAAEALGGRDPRLRVIPYGVNLVQSHPVDREGKLRSLGLPRDARIWGHLGRLTRQKNQRFMLEMLAAAREQDPELYLLIAGEGELRASLEAYARGLGIEDRVRFLGLRSDAAELLAGLFDVLVMPSLHEGLPVALLEAQAAGLPCLVSDEVNPESIVLEEQVRALPLSAGFVAWAEAAQRLVGRPRLDSAIAGQRLRRAGFDSEDSWARLRALYVVGSGDESESSLSTATEGVR